MQAWLMGATYTEVWLMGQLCTIKMRGFLWLGAHFSVRFILQQKYSINQRKNLFPVICNSSLVPSSSLIWGFLLYFGCYCKCHNRKLPPTLDGGGKGMGNRCILGFQLLEKDTKYVGVTQALFICFPYTFSAFSGDTRIVPTDPEVHVYRFMIIDTLMWPRTPIIYALGLYTTHLVSQLYDRKSFHLCTQLCAYRVHFHMLLVRRTCKWG